MTENSLPPSTLAWIVASIGKGAAVEAVQPLIGATSSTLHRLSVSYRGRKLRLVLRQFTNLEWLAEEPGLAYHEAASLQKCAANGLPAPDLIAYDGGENESRIPAILMTELPGKVDLLPANFDDWLYRQAEFLPGLHAIDPDNFPWRYAPYNDVTCLAVPEWSRQPHLWERAIEIANSPAPPSSIRFIHRDYHPTNVLWQDGRLSGVVDWPNACLGPAGIDVSWSRANLASLYGLESAERFLRHYRSLSGRDDGYHPYWDILVIIESLPGPPDVYPPWIEHGVAGLTPALMLERDEAYLASVLAKMG